MRIYLDNCCLNRPWDNQAQDRIRLESEAILLILTRVQEGKDEMISSDVLELENRKNPDVERQLRVARFLGLARERVCSRASEELRAKQLAGSGIGAYDALHVACAERAKADVLLTTDDRLCRRTRRIETMLRVRVMNPVDWLKEAVT